MIWEPSSETWLTLGEPAENVFSPSKSESKKGRKEEKKKGRKEEEWGCAVWQFVCDLQLVSTFNFVFKMNDNFLLQKERDENRFRSVTWRISTQRSLDRTIFLRAGAWLWWVWGVCNRWLACLPVPYALLSASSGIFFRLVVLRMQMNNLWPGKVCSPDTEMNNKTTTRTKGERWKTKRKSCRHRTHRVWWHKSNKLNDNPRIESFGEGTCRVAPHFAFPQLFLIAWPDPAICEPTICMLKQLTRQMNALKCEATHNFVPSSTFHDRAKMSQEQQTAKEKPELCIASKGGLVTTNCPNQKKKKKNKKKKQILGYLFAFWLCTNSGPYHVLDFNSSAFRMMRKAWLL